MKRNTSVLLIVFATLLLLVGCSKEDKVSSKLTGSWYLEGRDQASFTLYDDGTCEIAHEYGTGTWGIVNENQLKLTNYYGETQVATVSEVSKDKLVLTSDGSTFATFYHTPGVPSTDDT